MNFTCEMETTMKNLILTLVALGGFAACGGGAEGDPCKTDADCADGLECHMEEHEGEEEEEEGEEHDHDHEEGVCESHDDHDHD